MKGFRIFFLCLLLGTAAIASVESLSDAFLSGLRDQGQTLLGGDVAVHLVHRTTNAQEQAFLQGYGKISTSVSMRAMAYALRGGQQVRIIAPMQLDIAVGSAVRLRFPPDRCRALAG